MTDYIKIFQIYSQFLAKFIEGDPCQAVCIDTFPQLSILIHTIN